MEKENPWNPNLGEINENARRIVESIGRESIAVYLFLREQCSKGSVLGNELFQFVYRSFYRLDNAGLSPAFKADYFVCFEENRKAKDVDIRAVVTRLYEFPNLRGLHSLQFSFTTKLANTIDDRFPIYDRQVATVFGFKPLSPSELFDDRLADLLTFYDFLKKTYAEIISENRLGPAIQAFGEIYPDLDPLLPPIKRLDFIFWSAGKQHDD
jgi:hypothetical protein